MKKPNLAVLLISALITSAEYLMKLCIGIYFVYAVSQIFGTPRIIGLYLLIAFFVGLSAWDFLTGKKDGKR